MHVSHHQMTPRSAEKSYSHEYCTVKTLKGIVTSVPTIITMINTSSAGTAVESHVQKPHKKDVSTKVIDYLQQC